MFPIQIPSGNSPSFYGLEAKQADFLQDFKLFNGLDRSKLSIILLRSNTQTVPSGKLMFLQGDPASEVYFVLDGLIKLSRIAANGEESILSILTSGDAYIESVGPCGGSHPVSALTLTESRILSVPTNHFLEVALDDSRMAKNMLTIMAERIGNLIDRIEELSLKPAHQRLASYLATLCNGIEGTEIVRLPFDKCVIAQSLGMKPETLSRSFARLREVGVSVHRNTVTIRDVGKLRECGCVHSAAEPCQYAANYYAATKTIK
jgi:CRP-like cAMP-binding protein